MGIQWVEGSKGRKRENGEAGVGMMSAGSRRVDGLCVRLCGGGEWRPHCWLYVISDMRDKSSDDRIVRKSMSNQTQE